MSSLDVAATPLVSELVFSALSWLDVGSHAASLYDPAYHHTLRAHAPSEAWQLFRDDGPALARLFVRDNAVAIHALPTALESIDALRRLQRPPIAQALATHPQRANLARCHACSPELFEWLILDLALSARAFEIAYTEQFVPQMRASIEHIAPLLEHAVAMDPRIARYALRVSCALGMRGRALPPKTLFAGIGTAQSPRSPTHVVLQWLHECAVCEADAPYFVAEWTALCELAERSQSGPFREPHAAWISGFSLAEIANWAHASALCSRSECEVLSEGGAQVGEVLSDCARRLACTSQRAIKDAKTTD
ncbi:MAG: hypothetical protein Q8Q09_15405 [Deltaproteobacteria bacterium]|nr:hypothetical protein [Deltaproteobacteria bacterium]